MQELPIEKILSKKIDTDHQEKNLWRSVMLQAFMDAKMSISNDREKNLIRLRAINWLANMDEDFYIVCEFANLDPNYVAKNIQLLMADLADQQIKTRKNNKQTSLKLARLKKLIKQLKKNKIYQELSLIDNAKLYSSFLDRL